VVKKSVQFFIHVTKKDYRHSFPMTPPRVGAIKKLHR